MAQLDPLYRRPDLHRDVMIRSLCFVRYFVRTGKPSMSTVDCALIVSAGIGIPTSGIRIFCHRDTVRNWCVASSDSECEIS